MPKECELMQMLCNTSKHPPLQNPKWVQCRWRSKSRLKQLLRLIVDTFCRLPCVHPHSRSPPRRPRIGKRRAKARSGGETKGEEEERGKGRRWIHLQGIEEGGVTGLRKPPEPQGRRVSAALTGRLRKGRSQRVGPADRGGAGRGGGAASLDTARRQALLLLAISPCLLCVPS